MSIRSFIVFTLVSVLSGVSVLTVVAQQAGKQPEPAAKEENESPLNEKQVILSGRYRRFEKTMRQLTEYLRNNDPEKADLLVRAINKSSEERIRAQMEQIAAMLEREQFGDARDRQTEVIAHLRALLDLLQSENRLDALKAEQERIEDLIKDVNKTIAREKHARAANERGESKESATKKQQDVAEQTKKLMDKIDKQDAARQGEDPESQEGDSAKQGKQGEGKQGKSGESKEGKSGKSGESKEGKSGKSGESKDGKSGESQEGKQGKQGGKGQKKEGQDNQARREKGKQQQDNQPQDDSSQTPQAGPERTPGREEIERALREMERAIEKLQKENREGASDDQDKAIQELLKAKEKLEEVLRQLREEEREILLAALEARFQKMLQLQILVYTGTRGLARIPIDDWSNRQFGRSRELSQRENDIALEASKAIALLREEGSSVAFPESISQLREDMLLVAGWLEQNQVGDLTQAVEQDIIEALQETIEALQRELEKIKEQQQQQQQQGEPADPPLVDKLAELKMLRSLQYRVNRRTRQLGRLIQGEQAGDEQQEILQQLRDLADRQARIQEATYNLATGRNQ